MSLAEVTARINEIRSMMDQFATTTYAVSAGNAAPAGAATTYAAPTGAGASATTFASALDQASAAAGGATASAGATTGTTSSAGNPSGSSQQVDSATPYAELFNAAGAKYGVDPKLLAAVAKQESSYNPQAVSPAGARGLMQLMPATARSLGVSDPCDPAQAVDGAAKLLRDLLREFGRTDLALAAYNAGPGAVKRYDGIPPYRETQNYVKRIMADLGDGS